MADRVYTAAVLIIGNEVLSGRTQDANLAFLGKRLNDQGIRLKEARVIADDADAIVDAVNVLRAAHDYVFTTGGIGPTHDDITSACVARAFGVELHRHPDAERVLRAHYKPEDINEARLKMADVPVGADLVANPVSRAPGFRIGNVFVLAGVPSIMRAMFDGIAPTLAGGRPMVSRTVSAAVTEGALAEPLTRIQQDFPATEIGSYPFFRLGLFGVSIVVRGVDAGTVAAAAEAVRAAMRSLGAEPTDDLTDPA
jgi:molybdenum cofactor synthesis domain-containing protein